MEEDVVDFDALCVQVEVSYEGEPHRLGEAINLAVEAAAQGALDAGKKARVTVELEFDPDKRDTLLIAARVRAKVPEPGTFPIRVYADKKGRLTMSDPGQGKLRELRPDDHSARGGAA